jgi:hypothetical protein
MCRESGIAGAGVAGVAAAARPPHVDTTAAGNNQRHTRKRDIRGMNRKKAGFAVLGQPGVKFATPRRSVLPIIFTHCRDKTRNAFVSPRPRVKLVAWLLSL